MRKHVSEISYAAKTTKTNDKQRCNGLQTFRPKKHPKHFRLSLEAGTSNYNNFW